MLFVGFLIEILNGSLLLGVVPESLVLLASGVSLIGATVALRQFFKRRDAKVEIVEDDQVGN